jgi:hypothetical protein
MYSYIVVFLYQQSYASICLDADTKVMLCLYDMMIW